MNNQSISLTEWSPTDHCFMLSLLDISYFYKTPNILNKSWDPLNRPGKSVRCSSDPETGFLNVPQFCSHNLIYTGNIMSRSVLKTANMEQLMMILPPRIQLICIKIQIWGRLLKCSSIWWFWQVCLSNKWRWLKNLKSNSR